MLQQIRLSNFKAFPEHVIDLRAINIWVGANGSGKSTPIQALSLMKQSIGHKQPKLNGDYVRFGSVQEVLNGKSAENELHIGYTAQIEAPLGNLFGFTSPLVCEYDYTWQQTKYRGDVVKSWGAIKSQGAELRSNGLAVVPYELKSRRGVSHTFGAVALVGQFLQVTSGTNVPGINDSWKEEEQAKALASISESVLNSLHPIPSIRGFREPRYTLGSQSSDRIDYEAGMAATLEYHREALTEISHLMSRITGCPIDLAMEEPNQQINIMRQGTAPRRNIVTEGFGTNQLIPLLYKVVTASKGDTLAMEEPEIHLHPRAQAALFEVLTEAARQKSLQLILITHSPHLLLAALKQVKDKMLAPEKVSIREFSIDLKTGVADSSEISVSANGQLQRDLTNFFEPYVEEYQSILTILGTGLGG